MQAFPGGSSDPSFAKLAALDVSDVTSLDEVVRSQGEECELRRLCCFCCSEGT